MAPKSTESTQLSTLTPELVGRRYPEFRFFVTELWLHDYKRALGYADAQVLDADFVPESFVSCLRDAEFHVFDALGIELSQLLHAGQSYKFFDGIRAGDVMSSQAEITKLLRKKGKNGELVFLDIHNVFRRRERDGQPETEPGVTVAESTMSLLVRAAT